MPKSEEVREVAETFGNTKIRQMLLSYAALLEALIPDEQTPAPAQGTTPRTDAHEYLDHYGQPCVSADFARQLERELSYANEQIAALREALQQAHDAMEAFTDPEGNMPADTGEFRELKAAMLSAEKTLGGVR